jgi:DNA/RNA-binding protein KIN17
MNATKWSSLTEFCKHLGREGIVNVKEDEKDGLMIAWRDTSMQAVRRREEIRAQEAAEARNGAGEDKMLKRMAKRAQEEAEARAKATESRNAVQNKSNFTSTQSHPDSVGVAATVENTAESMAENTAESTAKTGDNTHSAEAVPVKISFGLKAKVPAQQKPGLGQMKNQSIFKRARAENGEDLSVKKVKL